MIIGNPSTVAIESGVSQAYAEPGIRALGFFAIHVGGRSFGVREAEATLLACSFDSVERRIERRGKHVASFAHASGAKIADAFRRAIYAPEGTHEEFGIPALEFAQSFYSSHLVWAPDGDEAFDDGSYVLQFDIGDRVRVIAFRCLDSGAHDPSTLSDVWIEQHEFYRLLTSWHDSFRAEWESLPKALA